MNKTAKDCLKNCVLISGTDQELSQKIADHLGLKLTNRISDTFSDGEVHVQILEDIRGKDVFIIQSTNPPLDQHLFPVLLLADAARRGFAKSINLVIPYFGYARQDRMAEPNTPISSKVIADILYSVSINHIITVDLHSAQTQGFFDMTIENITLEGQFAEYIEKNFNDENNRYFDVRKIPLLLLHQMLVVLNVQGKLLILFIVTMLLSLIRIDTRKIKAKS